MSAFAAYAARVDVVVIGASAGGVETLSPILGELRADTRTPIIACLHLPRERPSLLVDVFATKCRLPVFEAEDKQPIAPGHVYFAAPDYHVLCERDHTLALSVDDPVHFSRPSIDVLFESAADVYGARAMAVLLTGANPDGARGLDLVRQAGGVTVVQNPATAISPAMPSAALALGNPDLVLGIAAIGKLLGALR